MEIISLCRTDRHSDQKADGIFWNFSCRIDGGGAPRARKKPLVNNDKELTEYLEELRTRPEMKMLFQLTSKATKADVEKAVRIIEAMLREE